MTAEVEHATKYPGHYLGEQLGETAATAPAAILGGEAALAARAAGAAIPDDLATPGAIPHDLIDTPTPTGPDHPNPAPLGDVPSHHGTHAPVPDAPTPPLPADSPLFDGYDPAPPEVPQVLFRSL